MALPETRCLLDSMGQKMKWVLQGTQIRLERQQLMHPLYMQLPMWLEMPALHHTKSGLQLT